MAPPAGGWGRRCAALESLWLTDRQADLDTATHVGGESQPGSQATPEHWSLRILNTGYRVLV